MAEDATGDLRIEAPPDAPAPAGLAGMIRTQVRDGLGLPAARLTCTGHQPVAWHAGILAKFIAAAADGRCGEDGATGGWVHFVSDQDEVEPSRIDLPVRTAGGLVRRASVQCSGAWHRDAGRRPACAYPPFTPAHAPDDLASSTAVSAHARLAASLESHRGAPSAALQFARAVGECAAPWVPPPLAFITSAQLLAAAPLVLDRLLAEPESAARAFNDCLRIDRRAARQLRVAGDDSEVPLWALTQDGRRERLGARAARAALHDGGRLLPRAILASGLLRLCFDGFWHGTGGARYERVGTAWWRAFFGIDLPGFGVATATLMPSCEALGLPRDPGATPSITHRTAWWNPHLLAPGTISSDRRARLVEAIATAPRGSRDRAAHYAALHRAIEEWRSTVAPALERLESSEARARESLAQAQLMHDRTWPFLLHEPARLDALAAEVTAGVRRCRAAQPHRRAGR